MEKNERAIKGALSIGTNCLTSGEVVFYHIEQVSLLEDEASLLGLSGDV